MTMKKTLFGLAVGIFSITLLGFFAFHVKSSLAAGLSLSFSPNPANQSVTVTGAMSPMSSLNSAKLRIPGRPMSSHSRCCQLRPYQFNPGNFTVTVDGSTVATPVALTMTQQGFSGSLGANSFCDGSTAGQPYVYNYSFPLDTFFVCERVFPYRQSLLKSRLTRFMAERHFAGSFSDPLSERVVYCSASGGRAATRTLKSCVMPLPIR